MIDFDSNSPHVPTSRGRQAIPPKWVGQSEGAQFIVSALSANAPASRGEMQATYQLPKDTLPFRRARELQSYVWEAPIDRHLPDSYVESGGRKLFMLGGYSYLGLIRHPEVLSAAQSALEELGPGTHGATAMSGMSSHHRSLERALAEFWRREEAILYPSGYAANLSVLNALTRHGDVIFIDVAAHMSLHDGCRQSGAERVLFRHNDVADLEGKLAQHTDFRNRLVITDGAFSMDGDLCDLPAISAACKRHGAFLLVDECHSFGMLPPTGGGVEEFYGLPADTIDFRIGTVSKALPSHGGFVALSRDLADYVRHHGRQNIFSGAVPGFMAAAAEASLRLLKEHPEWTIELHRKARMFRELLASEEIDTGASTTAIVPIIIDDVDHCLRAAKSCFDRGVFLQPVLFPAVKRSRLRAGVTLSQKDEDLRSAADLISKAIKSSR